MKAGPNQRTMKFLKDKGWRCRKVEHWNSFAGRRIDLWGADVEAVHPNLDYPLLAQSTTVQNVHARMAKLNDTPEVKLWLRFGAFLVQGWKKYEASGRWEHVDYYGHCDPKTGVLTWHEEGTLYEVPSNLRRT